VLERLAAGGLQSDERYAEAYLSARVERGYGPERIRAELRERGVCDEIIRHCLDDRGEVDWVERLAAVRRRRFGADLPTDPRDRARQSRFLLQRGFSPAEIGRLLGPEHVCHD
jgi:regulatory protein